MTPTVLHGDCRDILPTLAAASVHCVVTSPPYWGLRDYGVANQLGLEATPAEYIATVVGVFREISRVMRPDATAWINLGDSFRAKQLLLMPARVALALQADGWYLRSDIIWAKPNPMPESVTDRPTSAHEHVFLLAKAARYFFDAEAVRESEISPGRSAAEIERQQRLRSGNEGRKPELVNDSLQWHGGAGTYQGGRNMRNVWEIATSPLKSAFSDGSYRIASRDCGVHDRQADLARVLECDAQQGVFRFARNPGSNSRPAELPEGAVVSIPLDRSELPSGVSSAIARNNLTRRTPELSERDVIFGDISGGHTECRGFLDHSFAMSARSLASNTLPDASLDGRLNCQPAGMADRIVGIATYEPRPTGCNCYYAGTVQQRQDHFASFPPALVERCIKAGTSERGCCPACGAPWVRVTQETEEYAEVKAALKATKAWNRAGLEAVKGPGTGTNPATLPPKSITTGWRPGCVCADARPPVPCTVLDPFAGAGTALLVADRLQRRAIGIELNGDYTRMAMARCRDDAPLFAGDVMPVPADAAEARMADLFAARAEQAAD